jgi:hypothetical protein
MPNSNVPTATVVTNPSKPVIAPVVAPVATPVLSPSTIVFPTALPASQAAGVAAIRVSRVNNDMTLEELNAQGGTIIGFVLDPVVDSATKKITGITVTQMGSSGVPIPSALTPAQISALSLITNELQQFKASKTGGTTGSGLPGPAKDREGKSAIGGWLGAIDTGIACGLAGVEGGANLLADAGCIAAYGAWQSDDGDGDVGDTEPPASVYDDLDGLLTEQVSTSFQTVSQDGVDDPIGTPIPYGGLTGGATDGSDDDGGGSSGEGIDGKPVLQPQ